MGGHDPLDSVTDTEAPASDFIRKNAEFIRFKAGEELDIVTIVYPIEGSAEPSLPRKREAAAPEPEAAGAVTERSRGGGSSLTLTLKGRIDTNSAPRLEEELKEAMPGLEELILDLNGLDYVSSAGLRVILMAQQTMNRQGRMVIRNVKEDVMDIFEVTGFVEILNIEEGTV